MNNAIITQMPTLCVPEKLEKKELIEQVNYLQDECILTGQRLHETSCRLSDLVVMANVLASHIGALVDSYEAGDQAAILLQVKKLAESRAAQRAKVH